jgi:hypothetical protein
VINWGEVILQQKHLELSAGMVKLRFCWLACQSNTRPAGLDSISLSLTVQRVKNLASNALFKYDAASFQAGNSST